MKNVDVPMWDKGDATDSFSKGGSSSSFNFQSASEKNPLIKEIYELVLGREPSSREISYYKYSALKKEDIIKKLLESEEHKDIVEKAKEVPDLNQKNRTLESTVLKLRSLQDDKENEYLELKRLLLEKNSTIEDLRESRDIPFLTDRRVLEQSNTHYNISKDRYNNSKEKESFLDRLFYLLGGNNR